MSDDPILDAITRFVEQNRHNPTFKFVYGNRAFTSQELLDNVRQNTPEGRKLREMVVYAGASILLK